MALIGFPKIATAEEEPSSRGEVHIVKVEPLRVEADDYLVKLEVTLEGNGEGTIGVLNDASSPSDIYVSTDGEVFLRVKRGQIRPIKIGEITGRKTVNLYIIVPEKRQYTIFILDKLQ